VSEVEIRSGGVVEVDTGSLRAAALRLRGVADEAAEIGRMLRAAADRLTGVAGSPPAPGLNGAASGLAEARERAEELARSVTRAAVLYETVELLAQRAAAESGGDVRAVELLDERLDRTADGWPGVRAAAAALLDEGPRRGDLSWQSWIASLGLGPVGASVIGLPMPLLGRGVDALARGAVAADQRLSGPREPVALRRIRTASTTPPATLAAAASRIPGGGQSRVRVERYTMPGGARQFAVYVAGTQAVGGADPFDVRSNLQLYGGQRSASYETVVVALERAGARPGDVVHAFGHSQGGMIAERLALEGRYDTRTVVSFGSPVQADLPAGTLAVNVRHTDDPIAALQGGGHPGGVGASGSFVVERSADPLPGLHDVTLPAHHMTAYAETAALVDASDDPRVDGLRQALTGLARAETAVSLDYAAERISPSSDAASRRGSR
jgi:hypothetical protein